MISYESKLTQDSKTFNIKKCIEHGKKSFIYLVIWKIFIIVHLLHISSLVTSSLPINFLELIVGLSTKNFAARTFVHKHRDSTTSFDMNSWKHSKALMLSREISWWTPEKSSTRAGTVPGRWSEKGFAMIVKVWGEGLGGVSSSSPSLSYKSSLLASLSFSGKYSSCEAFWLCHIIIWSFQVIVKSGITLRITDGGAQRRHNTTLRVSITHWWVGRVHITTPATTGQCPWNTRCQLVNLSLSYITTIQTEKYGALGIITKQWSMHVLQRFGSRKMTWSTMVPQR